MGDVDAKRPAADMDLHWLAEYLMRNGAANLCQLMKEQDDPVRWLEARAAPEFWQRISDAWIRHQMHQEPGRSGYVAREVSAHATTWVLVDAMLRDARERSADMAGTGSVDMNALLMQAGLTWFGQEKAREILNSALAEAARGADESG